MRRSHITGRSITGFFLRAVSLESIQHDIVEWGKDIEALIAEQTPRNTSTKIKSNDVREQTQQTQSSFMWNMM